MPRTIIAGEVVELPEAEEPADENTTAEEQQAEADAGDPAGEGEGEETLKDA